MNAVGYVGGAAVGLVLFVMGNVLGERRGRHNEVARRVAAGLPEFVEQGTLSDLREASPIRVVDTGQGVKYQPKR